VNVLVTAQEETRKEAKNESLSGVMLQADGEHIYCHSRVASMFTDTEDYEAVCMGHIFMSIEHEVLLNSLRGSISL